MRAPNTAQYIFRLPSIPRSCKKFYWERLIFRFQIFKGIFYSEKGKFFVFKNQNLQEFSYKENRPTNKFCKNKLFSDYCIKRFIEISEI